MGEVPFSEKKELEEMIMKSKILSLILIVALVVCGATALVKNNEAADVKAQLEAVQAQVAELTEAAAAAENAQAQLDEANAKIAELEAAAGEAVNAEAQTIRRAEDSRTPSGTVPPYLPGQSGAGQRRRSRRHTRPRTPLQKSLPRCI